MNACSDAVRPQQRSKDALRVPVSQEAVGEVMSEALRCVRMSQEIRAQVHQVFMTLLANTGLQQIASYADLEQVLNLIAPAVTSLDESKQGAVELLRDSLWIRINKLYGSSRYQSGNVVRRASLAHRTSIEAHTKALIGILNIMLRFPTSSPAYATYAAAAKRAARKCQLPFSVETLQGLLPSMTEEIARQIIVTGNKETIADASTVK